MKELKRNIEKYITVLCERYPVLKSVENEISKAYLLLEESYKNGGKLLIAGNGGSAADAYMNDCEPVLCFAQQVYGYGKAGDVFLGISTSGNSKNILYAATTARARGMKVIGLTGAKNSKLDQMCDVCIKVPQTETYKIQELHLPVYHCLCLMLENEFFEKGN